MKRQFDSSSLVDFCQRRTGENLKGVFTYNKYGNIKTHYLRDDLTSVYDDATLETIFRKTVSIEDAIRHMKDETPHIGHPRASLHTFQHAVIVQLYGHNNERGALAMFDTSVASRHMEFLEELQHASLMNE